MKNLFTTALSAMFLLLFSAVSAQSFEGVIQYKITYENLPAEMAGYESMLPSEATSTIKGHLVKMEQPLSMGMKQVTIMDNKAESGVLLMDMMGKKMAIVLDKESREKYEENQEEPVFKYTDEKKTIAGYDCKKALMILPAQEGQEEVTLEIFYTDKIDSPGINQMKGLKGFPLEYSTSNGTFLMTLTAANVEKKKINEQAFAIPDGYEHMTFDQFQQSMGGMMGE